MTKQALSRGAPDAADATVYAAPDGTQYRIGRLTLGKTPNWRTERWDGGAWKPANSSIYPDYENAKNEFDAWIRREALQPVAASVPEFDTTGLDRDVVLDLQLAEREYRGGKRMAEMGIRRMADGVAIAHEALCGSCDNLSQLKHGNRGDKTFRAWCDHMAINRKAAERLLQVAKLFDESTPNQEKLLEELSPSLLYAAAQPSAPAALVQGVKNGDITTHKQYQELLEELRARDAKLQALKDENQEIGSEANAMLKELDETKKQLQEAENRAQDAAAKAEHAHEAAHKFHLEQQRANEIKNALLDQQSAHLARIAELEKALRAQPIEMAVAEPDPETIDRLAAEKAEEMTAELQRRLAEATQKDRESDNRAWHTANDDYEMVVFALQTMKNAWLQAAPRWERMAQNVRCLLRGNLREAICGVQQALNACTEAPDAGM